MEAPHRELIIHCVAKSIYFAAAVHAGDLNQLQQQQQLLLEEDEALQIFDERYYPLSHEKRSFYKLPLEEEVFHFVNILFCVQSLSAQVGIMAVHYIDLIIHRTGLRVTPSNWRRLLLCSLMVADKVWEEDVVCNADFCTSHFPLLTLDDINTMEREFLKRLEFKLILKTSVYAEYYFALRSILGSSCFPCSPLDKETAQQLLIKKSLSDQPQIINNDDDKNRRRSFSVDQIFVEQQNNNNDNNKQRQDHHRWVREEIDTISLEQFSEQMAGRSIR